MEKLSFRVDDPEILEFVYSLGRERSKVICALLRECMEEGGGYVPPRIMAATGFSYKNKKSIKGSGTSPLTKRKELVQRKSATPKKLLVEPVRGEPKVEEIEQVQEPVIVPTSQPEVKAVEEPVATGEYASSAPKISNPAMIAAGLSAFSV